MEFGASSAPAMALVDAPPFKFMMVSGASLSSFDTQLPSDSEAAHDEAFWIDEPESWALPSQTLLFLDWDDTLFPTTELMDRRRVPEWGHGAPEEVLADLGAWRVALKDFLLAASAACSRCVILTNAGRPWVDVCIARFAPELIPMFSKSGPLRVVYAKEALKRAQARKQKSGSCCLAGLATRLSTPDREDMSTEERRAYMTAGKRAGMEEEAAGFYGAGPWENILSIGDACYERNAVRSLVASHNALRVKAITTPKAPSLECLVESLSLARLQLADYVASDGHLDLEQSISGLASDQF